jgi:hypothetical protein
MNPINHYNKWKILGFELISVFMVVYVTVLGDHRLLVDNGDKNVYNLTQLPMLQGYTPNQTSSNRYKYILLQ